MDNIKQLKRLRDIHQRIISANTGTPKEMARQMYISERTFYNLMEELKFLGAKVRYCREYKTYYYEEEFDLQFSCSLKVICKGKIKKIFGGAIFSKKNYFTAWKLS